VVGFTPTQTSNVEFVHELMRFLREILERRAPQVAQKNINLEILRDLQVPIPPAGLQHRFACIAQRIEREKCIRHVSYSRHPALFDTLQQSAFAGMP